MRKTAWPTPPSRKTDALRAIKPPRHLTVDTSVANGRASVAVADNGRGLSPDIAPRLFRPFTSTKGRRGTGLGLYISRQIAREAGGDLVLVGAGVGARFVLSLPVAELTTERPEAAEASAGREAEAPGAAVSLAGR